MNNSVLHKGTSKLSSSLLTSWKLFVLGVPVATLFGWCMMKIWRRLKRPRPQEQLADKMTQVEEGRDFPVEEFPERASHACHPTDPDDIIDGEDLKTDANGDDSGFSEIPLSPSAPGLLEDKEREIMPKSSSPEPISQNPASDSEHPCAMSESTQCSAVHTNPFGVDRERADIHLPTGIVGRFIGRQGRNIKSLMEESGSQIHVQQQNMEEGANTVPCVIQGTHLQIIKVLDLISTRHPDAIIPNKPFRSNPFSFSSNIMAASPMHLLPTLAPIPMRWDVDIKPATIPTSPFLGIVTHVEDINRFWVIPYSVTKQIDELIDAMAKTYFDCKEPNVFEGTDERPNEQDMIGKFCAVQVSEIHWLRGRVTSSLHKGARYKVLLVDYGSSAIVRPEGIKPLRNDFAHLPAQATHCVLAYIDPFPIDPSIGGAVLLQSFIEAVVLQVGFAGTTYEGNEEFAMVELYVHSQYGSPGKTYINRELVNQGFARWRETLPVPHLNTTRNAKNRVLSSIEGHETSSLPHCLLPVGTRTQENRYLSDLVNDKEVVPPVRVTHPLSHTRFSEDHESPLSLPQCLFPGSTRNQEKIFLSDLVNTANTEEVAPPMRITNPPANSGTVNAIAMLTNPSRTRSSHIMEGEP